ncbi:MAG: DNA repair exonuclease [Candidatus Eisenbacteria sp.]|nr:DNA repair exonuclease [Candidatus Eisenbacteria bacterium]
MIRILHLADLHLGRSHSYLGDRATERKREADGVLRRVVDRVLKDPIEVDAVVIAGDLFETYKPEASLVGDVIRELRRLVDAGKTVITLPGNHDELSYSDCVYLKHKDRWPGILVTSPQWSRVATVETAEGTCHFYGLAYQAGITSGTLDTSIALEPEGLHVAILHASVNLPGGDRSIHTTSKELAGLGVDYVALGHIHKPDVIRLLNGLAVYPGLIEGSGFDDPGCSELTVVRLGDGNPRAERIPLETRRIETRDVDLGSLGDPDALREAIEEMADADLILRLVLMGAAGFEPPSSLLQTELSDCFYHFEIDDGFTLMETSAVDAAAREETPLAIVIRTLREKERQAETEKDKTIVRLALRHAWQAWRGGQSHG